MLKVEGFEGNCLYLALFMWKGIEQWELSPKKAFPTTNNHLQVVDRNLIETLPSEFTSTRNRTFKHLWSKSNNRILQFLFQTGTEPWCQFMASTHCTLLQYHHILHLECRQLTLFDAFLSRSKQCTISSMMANRCDKLYLKWELKEPIKPKGQIINLNTVIQGVTLQLPGLV
jgi:hypothetical protein